MARSSPTANWLRAFATLACLATAVAAGSTGAAPTAAPNASADPVTVWLVPHSHCDVGWLETFEGYAAYNVSHILDTVVAVLGNDPTKSRRFVWDEISFFERWFEVQPATVQEQVKSFVDDGRLEFCGGGWVQHDMATTTTEGIVSQMMTGQLYLKDRLNATVRVGWGLDIFGISASNPTLQALMGMDAAFVTRLPGDTIAEMQASQGLEFTWQASSSLPPDRSQMFVHVLESYFCQPGQFRWGINYAPVPTDDKIPALAELLSNITKQRAPWFRTPNVFIPFGCDFMWQGEQGIAAYNLTDKIVQYINENTGAWGVKARFGTPTEYMTALGVMDNRADASARVQALASTPDATTPADAPDADVGRSGAVTWPVKGPGTDFYPYLPNPKQAWTGYYTSRPMLKGLSREAYAWLHAAEVAYGIVNGAVPGAGPAPEAIVASATCVSAGTRHVSAGGGVTTTTGMHATTLYDTLEEARRSVAIVQHHDAITGTGCSSLEGCTGGNQMSGGHDVVTNYMDKCRSTIAGAGAVVSAVLGHASGIQPLSADESVFAATLMAQGPVTVVVFNPDAHERTDLVRLHGPTPFMAVTGAKGQPVVAQTSFDLTVPDLHEFDFTLQFVATVAPLGYETFTVTPGAVVGSNASGAAVVTGAEVVGSPRATGVPRRAPTHRPGDVSATPEPPRTEGADTAPPPSHQALSGTGIAQLDNPFYTLYLDNVTGLVAVLDKATAVNHTLSARFYRYQGTDDDAYAFAPMGPATPLVQDPSVTLTTVTGPVASEAHIAVGQYFRMYLRLLNSTEPALGQAIEIDTFVGPIEEGTELALRFDTGASGGVANAQEIFTDDNNYEMLHRTFNASRELPIAANYWPATTSAFIRDGTTQLSMVFDRSHGVSSPAPGAMEVMLHRRLLGHAVSGAVILDDATRIQPRVWITLGAPAATNRVRHALVQRATHPLVPLSSATSTATAAAATPASSEAVEAAAAATGVTPRRLSFSAMIPRHMCDSDDRVHSSPSMRGGASRSEHITAAQPCDRKSAAAAPIVPQQVQLHTARVFQPQGIVSAAATADATTPATATATAGASVMYVRLFHSYAKGEDATLSQPVTVDLAALLPSSAVSCTEVTLTGMFDVSTVAYGADGDAGDGGGGECSSAVTLNPFDFRTFRVQLS